MHLDECIIQHPACGWIKGENTPDELPHGGRWGLLNCGGDDLGHNL